MQDSLKGLQSLYVATGGRVLLFHAASAVTLPLPRASKDMFRVVGGRS